MKTDVMLWVTTGCFLLFTACAGSVVSDIPANPEKTGKYIFYFHGSTEEDVGTTEKHEAAVSAIAEGSATVIAEVRGDTAPVEYAAKVMRQVNALIAGGVPSKNIAVTGFSKGAIIALATAEALQNPEVNYVLLAGCSKELNDKYGVNPKKALGRILSMYDIDDEKFGPCAGMITRSEKVKCNEIEFNSGKGHKLFRIPKEKFIEKWRDPLLEWADA